MHIQIPFDAKITVRFTCPVCEGRGYTVTKGKCIVCGCDNVNDGEPACGHGLDSWEDSYYEWCVECGEGEGIISQEITIQQLYNMFEPENYLDARK